MPARPASASSEPLPQDRPIREILLSTDVHGPGPADAPLARLLADVMAGLGRAADDPRPLPAPLLDDLAPTILPQLAAYLAASPGTPIDGRAALTLLPLWLRAIETSQEAAHPVLTLPDPTAGLCHLAPQDQVARLLHWLSLSLTAERATRDLPRDIRTLTAPQTDPTAFPALCHLVRRVQGAVSQGDHATLDHLSHLFAPLISATPLLLRQWSQPGPARATLAVLRRRILPLLTPSSEPAALILASLAEIELAILSHSQPDASHDLRRTRRLLRRLIRDPRPLIRLHLAHCILKRLQILRPILSAKRFSKLERSTDKRDPEALADRWAGVANRDRTRFYGALRPPPRLDLDTASTATQTDLPALAIVVHAFYRDVFADILDRLALLDGVPFTLFVTCPKDLCDDLRKMADLAGVKAELLAVENLGRDVRPFFAILPKVAEAGFPVILKLHTKKSVHRSDGALWGGSIVSALTRPDAFHRILQAFVAEPQLGLVAAQDHVLPIGPFLLSNAPHLRSLATPAKIDFATLLGGVFTAGTMLFLRTDLAMDLSALIEPDRFEPEAAQVDGTYAHAIERFFVVYAQSRGWVARDTDMRLL